MKKIPRVYKSAGRYYFVEDLDDRNERTGKRKQKWHPLTRVADGDAALLAKLATLPAFAGGPIETSDGDMPAAIKRWLSIVCPTLTPGVAKEYRRIMGKVSAAFEAFNVGDVRPVDCEEYLATLAKTPTLRHHTRARMSGFFGWCVRADFIKQSPLDKVRLPMPPKRRGRFSADAYWQLHDALPPIGQSFLQLLFLTGQRPTEIRLLQESQIAGGYIHFVPTKTARSSGEEVKVRITPDIERALATARSLARVKSLPGGSGYLIQTTGGVPFSRSGLLTMWTRSCKKAGLAGITTRDVRPYALDAMKRAGYTTEQIQQVGAHARMATTEGYLEQYRDRVSDAVIPLPTRKT